MLTLPPFTLSGNLVAKACHLVLRCVGLTVKLLTQHTTGLQVLIPFFWLCAATFGCQFLHHDERQKRNHCNRHGLILYAIRFAGFPLKAGQTQGLTVRPELVEGWTVKPFMVRQAHHERLNL